MTASASTSHRPLSRSMVRIETVPSPENAGGRRTARQATIVRVRWRPEIREAKRERGSQPDARRADVGRRVRARRRGEHDARGRAVLARVDVLAVEGQRARDLQRGRVADVDLGDDGLACEARRGGEAPRPATGSTDDRAGALDHEQALAVEQQVSARATRAPATRRSAARRGRSRRPRRACRR